MTICILASGPDGAAPLKRLGRILMDVILHLGAHRTATTTFQHYLDDHQVELAARNVQVWGPKQTRKSIFPGLFRPRRGLGGRQLARRAEGRVRMLGQLARERGVSQLLISDENLLGSCRQSLAHERIYPAAGERIARVASAFGEQIRRIVFSIRSQDLWWASAAALTVARGHPVPTADRFTAIAASRRTWRDVITDIACAAPEAEIRVMPFESNAGRPDMLLACALDADAPACDRMHWLNRSPDLIGLRRTLAEGGRDPGLLPEGYGRWAPFTETEAALLRENYADDLHWLTAGADGLARLTEDTFPTKATQRSPGDTVTKGQGHDKGHMAENG